MQFNDQLPAGLIAQLVRALHRYRRGQGASHGKPDFFRLSFRNCISCVNNCEDLLYIYFLTSFVCRSFQSPVDGECEDFLQRLCSNDVSMPLEHAVHTLVLNKHGGIELNCTVIRSTENRWR